ncbi:hypothetical protein AMTRI_Chr03g146120 [Amborella trichopoda]
MACSACFFVTLSLSLSTYNLIRQQEERERRSFFGRATETVARDTVGRGDDEYFKLVERENSCYS